MTKQVIHWDTTENISQFPHEIRFIFNKFYFYEKKKFTSWIDRISYKFTNDIDWWVSPPVSRNLYISDLYKNICILKTINFFKKKKLKIIIDNLELKKILKKNFPSNNLHINLKYNKKLFKKYLILLYLLVCILKFSLRFFLIKFLIKKYNHKINTKITLIDTYVINSDLKEKSYYGNLLKYSKKVKKVKILFIPTIIQDSIFKFYKILILFRDNHNYLFKESLLNFKDLLFCIFYFFRKKKFKQSYYKFDNYELSNLIYDEIKYNRDFFSIFLALTNYCFVNKLRFGIFKIAKVINWFENQPKDKAWNYSFRKYFPKVTTIGYQGFTSYSTYTNTMPSKFEFKSKVIPEKIIVMSKNYIKLRKEFCKILQIEEGPALRFEKLFSIYKKNKIVFGIVIFMEGLKEFDKNILIKFINISKNFPTMNFYIKAHPIMSIEKLNVNLPKNFIVLEKDFPYIASRCIISIAYGNTSALIESIAYGCKLIVPFDNLYDKYIFKKLKIKNNLFKICANDKIIIESIKKFLKVPKKTTLKNSMNLKNYLFNKVTQKNILRLL